jgi:Fe-Mn family superoxide dismutase
MIAQENQANFVLPSLNYDYGDLEPAISGEIMQLHHTKHHQAYVNNLNIALQSYREAESRNDVEAMISLEPVIRFNGGGHLNHDLFWKMLTPVSKGGGQIAKGTLLTAIETQFGSFDTFKERLTKASLGIQGSGWGWLAYHQADKRLVITTCSNQDPISTQGLVGLLGLDVWEHAYYLQYKNVRGDYLKNIWQVINWNFVQKRFEEIQK